jgi:ABC-2 type transport system permease protein
MSLSYALSDSTTMLRRNIRHTLRNPINWFGAIVFPVILLLMFVYVMGGMFGDGREQYLAYIAPGMLIMSVGYGVGNTATGVSFDMTKGIINRFRTMAISRASVLTGHVVGSVLRIVASVAAILGVTVLMGFRPSATPVEWLAVLGLVVLLGLACSWLTVACGLAAKTPDAAAFLAFPLTFLPFISSAFAPPNSMPGGVAWFADNQPFTPVIETLRGLMTGTGIGSSGWLAVAWCVGIALAGYLWARARYNRT